MGNFVHNGFEALFEFAAKLRARDEAAHIQGKHAALFEFGGDVAGDDALGEAFGDGGFADAGAADKDGVVFGAADEGLHNAGDFVVAADDGVKLAVAGELGEVNAVAFQGAIGAFGARVGDAAVAAHFLERLIDCLLGDAEVGEQARGGVLGVGC